MEAKKIDISALSQYVFVAFVGDKHLLEFYDRVFLESFEGVPSVFDLVENVCQKVATYHDAQCYGLEDYLGPCGYFVHSPHHGLLVSFGLAVRLRGKGKEFFEIVKKNIGSGFNCVIFSYNVRAVKWLKANGMKVRADSITVLENSK